jgi:peptidoglycan/xylan/chitin deacetylase (PgdA/CDA1 family)
MTMPRITARRGLQLAGAMLIVAAFAGCGTAMAADGTPVWSSTPPAAGGVGGGSVVTPSAAPKPKPSSSTAPPAPRVRPQTGRGPAKSAMKTGTSAVALTFDDGPDPVQTPRLLDLLATNHVKATFCLVGQNVAAHPDLVRRIVAEGHTLCNHTWRHSLTLGKQKPAEIRADLQRTNDAIHAAVPGAEIKYMRAPGGNFTPNFVKVAADLGMSSIYWQVDPRDWDHPAGESDAAHKTKVLTTIKTHVRPGAIILSHDYQQPDTIAVYRTLLPWLHQRYRLIALP